MSKFKLTIEYEGTRYKGWQIQKEVKTIQGSFFVAVEEAFNTQKFEFYGAGRTDAGVHATAQVAHLEVSTQMACDKIRYRLNDLLPYDINVKEVVAVPLKFHARHDAVYRSYVYIISKERTAFGKNLVWWVKDQLDFNKMKETIKLYEGFKDFSSFADTSSGESESTKVELKWARIYETADYYAIHILGSHFLWKMVRRMVGVLVEAGRGKLSYNEIESFFKAPSTKPAHYTAPPSGLYLERVYYKGESVSEEFYAYVSL